MGLRAFWPAAEAAQVDYETLRAAALAGTPLIGVAAARFAGAGLAGLVAHPVAEPVFVARVVVAARPAWTPYADPREGALAAAFALVLGVTGDDDRHDNQEVAQ